MKTKPMHPVIAAGRLQTLASDLLPHAPQWLDRLVQARSQTELLNLVCDLFNLAHSFPSTETKSPRHTILPDEISGYIGDNLHRGLTLKVLAGLKEICA